MIGYAATLDTPSFSNVLERPRLTRLAGSSGDRPIVFTAASGFGKTVVAAQYAAQQPSPVVWLSLHGEPVERRRVLHAMCSVLSRANGVEAVLESMSAEELEVACAESLSRQLADGALLVMDDAGRPGSDPVHLLDGLESFLVRHRIRTVITTRHALVGDSPAMVIDRRLLSFSGDEVRAAASMLGRHDLSDATIAKVGVSGAGHPALTITMLAAADPGGDERLPSEARQIAKRIADQALSSEQRRLLECLSLLGRASVRDLKAIGFDDPLGLAQKVVELIPLVGIVNRDDGPGAVVQAHDLLSAHMTGSAIVDSARDLDITPTVLLDVLARNGAGSKLQGIVLSSAAADISAQWLERSGELALSALGHEAVLRLIDVLPLGLLVRRPRLMLLWATVLLESGHINEAVTKARVACRLAVQDADSDCFSKSASTVVTALSFAGRPDDAWDLGVEYLANTTLLSTPGTRCELLASLASAAATAARTKDFCAVETAAREEWAADKARCNPALRRIRRSRATLHATLDNDWRAASEVLSPLLCDDADDDLLFRIATRGNLAFCMAELGRLSRARGLLTELIGCTVNTADSSFLPAQAMVMAAEGDTEGAVVAGLRGIELASAAGDEMDAHLSRVTVACLQRVHGDLAGSLETAELAYEGLGQLQVGGFRSLAALEVAATLLAMDDTEAARRWVALSEECGHASDYRELRADMILAECCRRENGPAAGIELLSRHANYVLSENSNWQIAMYARVFPHVLAMLSVAVGAKALPAHMLSMVPVNIGEAALESSRSHLDAGEWAVLGRRILGEERYNSYVDCKTKSSCRVKLFGGMEVVVDGRVVAERDWAKRKGRVIFAILVGRRGQEVVRDQLLEYLWPDMDAARAKNNFYVAWSSMKAALRSPDSDGECLLVDNARGRCRIVRDRVHSDIDDFEDLVVAAREAERAGNLPEALKSYASLVSVYRGDLLPGDIYDDWFAPLREKYRVEFLESMVRGASIALTLQDPDLGLQMVRRGLAMDPYREDLYQVALKCHMASGQRAAAIEAFFHCKTQLADELGLDPSSETIALYQQVLGMEESAAYGGGSPEGGPGTW